MFKPLAVAMIAATASCTQVMQAFTVGPLTTDEPLLTPQGSVPPELEGVKACLSCTAMVTAADSFLQLTKTKESAISIVTKACLTFHLADNPTVVCPLMIPQMANTVFDVISTDLISKNRICNQFLGYCANPKYKEIGVEDYTTRVLKDKPASIADDNFVNNLYTQIKADTKPRKTLKVVHMSDPHIDMEYKA